jgi:hypothetical protein
VVYESSTDEAGSPALGWLGRGRSGSPFAQQVYTDSSLQLSNLAQQEIVVNSKDSTKRNQNKTAKKKQPTG